MSKSQRKNSSIDDLLSDLSEAELELPEYYPLDLALGYIAYAHKPLPVDYARIIYDYSKMSEEDLSKLNEAEKSLHVLLRAEKIKSRHLGVVDQYRDKTYYDDGWQELKPELWSGSMSGLDCKMFYTSEEEKINFEYQNIEVNLEDLLASYPLKRVETDINHDGVGQTERRSFYKLIYGMAKAKYQYDPNERNSAIANISTALRTQGIPLDEGTIRKYLKDAATFTQEDKEN